MNVSTRLTAGRGIALAVLGAIGLIYVALIATTTSSLLVVALGAVFVGGALYVFNLLANRAAVRLRSVRLPGALYAAFTGCAAIGLVAIVETGLLFQANEAGAPADGLVALMIATGVVGVATVAALVGLTALLLVRLVRESNGAAGSSVGRNSA